MGIPIKRLQRLVSCADLVDYAAIIELEAEEARAAYQSRD